MIIPKTKQVYEKNSSDIKIVLNVLSCVERTLDKLDRPMIIDEVLPMMWDVRLSDPEVILRVVSEYPKIYKKKYWATFYNYIIVELNVEMRLVCLK